MKKTILILALVLVAFSACRKLDPAEKLAVATYDLSQLSFDFSVQNPSDTKAVKSGWAAGDVVFVFFEDVSTHYVTLTYSGSAWGAATLNGEGEASLTADGTLTAIYLPYRNSETPIYAGSAWSFPPTCSDSYFLRAEKTSYHITDMGDKMGTLGAVLYMDMPSGYAQFFIPNGSAAGTVRLACNVVKPAGLASISSDCTVVENTSGAQGGWMTGYNATVGEDTGYYVSGKPVSNPGADCYFALETEEAAAYKHYYKWRNIPIASRGAYKLPVLSSWISVSSSEYVSVAGYRWCTVNDGASMPWAVGTAYASNAGAPVDLAWSSLLNAAKTRWLSMSIGGVSGSLVVEKADETHYLFLPVGDYWSSTSSHYLHLESGGAKQFKTTDPPGTAYLRSVKFGFSGDFDDPISGGDI